MADRVGAELDSIGLTWDEGVEVGAVEITTCLRRGEVEMVTRYEPRSAEVYRRLMALVRDRHGAMVFSEDGSLVDDQVARLLAGRRIATAEL